MNKITVRNNLNQVVSYLPDKNFDFMVRMASGPIGWLLGTISFQRLSKIAKVWDENTMVEGMNFLIETANRSRVFYPIYTDEEKQTDKGKRLTGLACFYQKNTAKLAMVIPGGGYGSIATMQEGYPVAKALYEKNYSVVVLQYRCGRYAKAPNTMDDLAQAMRVVLKNADEWKIDPEDYAVIGFSAGGHLAASFGTEALGYARYDLPKPGVMVLGYPVITMGKFSHDGSRKNLLRSRKDLWDAYSIEKQITENYPKTFVWQCNRDNTVPIENTRLLAETLKEHGVPYIYETFSSDAHGWGLATGTVAQGWLERAVQFWENQTT